MNLDLKTYQIDTEAHKAKNFNPSVLLITICDLVKTHSREFDGE